MNENQGILPQLLQGKLPEVQVKFSVTKETLVDMAAASVIVAIVCILINKFIISRI